MSDQNYFLSSNITGDFNDSTVDNSGYGSLSAAEKNQTYFAYFNGVGGTGPEIIDQTAYFIKYLIDAQGKVVTPQPNSIDVLNLLQNFEARKLVNVTNLEGTTLYNTLLGTKTITNFGKIETIAVSQTGYNVVDYTSSLTFSPPTTTYGSYDYSFLAKWADPQIITGSITSSFTPVKYSNETSDVNANYDSSTYSYGIPNNTMDYSNTIKFIATLQIGPAVFNPTGQDDGSEIAQTTAYLRIVTSSTANPTVYDYVLSTSVNNITGYSEFINVSSDYINFTSGSRVRVEMKVSYNNDQTNGTTTPPYIWQTNNSVFKLQTTYGVIATASANYWTTGSTNDRYVTASTQLTNLYNLGYFQRAPTASLLIGFNEIYNPFHPSPGDYIRFEYNPLKTFNIKNVTIDESSTNLVLDLGQPIQTGTNINNFVIYRINPNSGNQLILNVPKPPNTTGVSLTGFIKPQHMTKELEDNFTTIIQKLAAEGTI
jgi:hypothetical protein